MISKELLALLVCPANRTPLTAADTALVERINRAIARRRLQNKGGRVLEKSLDGGLVREDGALFYPIQDGIPVLLVDEAIELSQLDDVP